MAEFMTFRRWVITDVDKETEVVALVRDAIVLAYQQLPGCLKLGYCTSLGPISIWRPNIGAVGRPMRLRSPPQHTPNGGRPTRRPLPTGTVTLHTFRSTLL